MKRLFPLLLALAVVASFGFAGCGGDDDDDTVAPPPAPVVTETQTQPGAAAETVDVAADPGGALEFEQNTLEASAGSTTFELTNESSVPHDFVIEQDGEDVAKTDVITNDTDTVTAELEAGEYAFYCSVPGHREAGMEGELTVE